MPVIRRSGAAFAALVLAGLCSVALAGLPPFEEREAIRDSLSQVHPRFRASWLKERGIRDDYWQGCVKPVDSVLRCVGRWSYGPSYDVDGRVTPTETLVALARGSGVSLIRFARTDSIELELLADVNAGGLMKRVAVRDSLLYVGSTAGLEVWSISDERSPRQLSWLHTALNDFALQDSFAYVIGPDDSFKVYSVANAANPVRRGACRDSGDLVSVAGNSAFIGDRWGMYVVDVSNPAAPHRIGSWGGDIMGLGARGRLCFVTNGNPNQPDDLYFSVLDVSTPSAPVRIGYLSEAGGYDICLLDTLAFLSGYGTGGHEFSILSIADSTHPRTLGSAATPGLNWGVWASGPARSGFVADAYVGMQVFDARNTAQPVRDTGLLGADMAVDVHVDAGRAYVADYRASLRVLDVSNPTTPNLLGSYRSGDVCSAVARDSFAFIAWPRPRMLTVDVSDPARPESAGACEGMFNKPEDMVLRDSYVYCAEMNRFQVVNVARPRQPVLVGTCSGDGVAIVVQDSFAYTAAGAIRITNVARPDSPFVVCTITGHAASGLAVRDTFLYAPYVYDSLLVYSLADVSSPRLLSSTPTGIWPWDIALGESLAFVGATYEIAVYELTNPAHPRRVGGARIPHEVRRLGYTGGLLYATFWEAGVGIYETESTALQEDRALGRAAQPTVSICPNPVSGRLRIGPLVCQPRKFEVRDVAGRAIENQRMACYRDFMSLDVTSLAAGAYFVQWHEANESMSVKFVKR